MRRAIDLNNREFAVIDMDSGTILGTNVKIVRIDDVPPEQWEDALSSDSEAWDVAHEYGFDLWVLQDEDDNGD